MKLPLLLVITPALCWAQTVEDNFSQSSLSMGSIAAIKYFEDSGEKYLNYALAPQLEWFAIDKASLEASLVYGRNDKWDKSSADERTTLGAGLAAYKYFLPLPNVSLGLGLAFAYEQTNEEHLYKEEVYEQKNFNLTTIKAVIKSNYFINPYFSTFVKLATPGYSYSSQKGFDRVFRNDQFVRVNWQSNDNQWEFNNQFSLDIGFQIHLANNKKELF